MLGVAILSSIFLGSALSSAIAKFLIAKFNFNFFLSGTSYIPSFELEKSLVKTFDLLDFGLSILLTTLVFLFFHFFLKSKNKLINLSSLIFSFIIFLQIHFAAFNLVYTVGFIIAFYALLTLIVKSKMKIADYESLDTQTLFYLANGLFLGFGFMLIISQFTSTILPLSALFVTPLFYLMFSRRLIKIKSNNVIVGILYPIVFIFLVVYNPLYYLGHFDSVEEGFWLGWLQGLRSGKALYRDIAAYHPPLIIWILNIFQQILGYSIKNTRLVLHLLQIIGVVCYFLFANSLLKTKLSKFVSVLVAISLTTIMVRNNVEIRLGVGLLSLSFISQYFKTEKSKFLFFSGITTAPSIFTSVEVGVSVFIAQVIGILLFSKQKTKNISYFALGGIIPAFFMFIILIFQGAFFPMLSQISFYASEFSKGYFNLAVDRPAKLAFIHWHIINQYFSEHAFYWELARGGILAAILLSISKFRLNKFENNDKFALIVGIFAIIIFRSALGRSDFYHLLFPLLVSIPLIFFTLEKLKSSYLTVAFSGLLVFVFMRNIVNASFAEAKLYSLQTYGKVIGEQELISTFNQEQVVEYLKSNTDETEKIFVYPWNPEIYMLANRDNAISHYTPYAFFTEKYQEQMITELEQKKPSLVIYNPEMIFGNLTPDSLHSVNIYILENYREITSFGEYKVLKMGGTDSL